MAEVPPTKQPRQPNNQPQGGGQKGYGKRPLWQWIVIYLVIGIILYGLFYFFVLADNGSNGNGNGNGDATNNQTEEADGLFY